MILILEIKNIGEGFPDGPVVKNLACNTGDIGLIPGLGRCHLPQGNQALSQLLKPTCPRVYAAQQEKSQRREALGLQPERNLRSLQLEKVFAQQQRPSTVKSNKNNKKHSWI